MSSICTHGYAGTYCTHCQLMEKIKELKDSTDKDLIFFLNCYKIMLDKHEELRITWRKIAIEKGHEYVKQLAIKSLRDMADQLEKNAQLLISHVEFPHNDPPASKDIMDKITVEVSYPWGG
jgi:hypothetical protein